MACNYTTVVLSSTQLPIWGTDVPTPGPISDLGTVDQAYHLTGDGVQDISHYIGNTGQYLQRFSRFSISFDFFIQGGWYPGDAIYLMVGGASPASTLDYISEDSGQGVKVVIGCNTDNIDLYNKVGDNSVIGIV
jgi:hypothetical protein